MYYFAEEKEPAAMRPTVLLRLCYATSKYRVRRIVLLRLRGEERDED